MHDREDLPDPGVLHEIVLAVCRSLYHDVWAKPPDLEATLRIQRSQSIEGGRRQEMRKSTVEKSTLRQTEVGDGVPVIETLDIRPVLLRGGRRQIGQCGQLHPTLENFGKARVGTGLVTLNDGAVR